MGIKKHPLWGTRKNDVCLQMFATGDEKNPQPKVPFSELHKLFPKLLALSMAIIISDPYLNLDPNQY